MSGRQRLLVLGLVAAALVVGAALLVFASVACPAETATQACPNAALNRGVVICLLAVVTLLLTAPFAFLAEFAARRRRVSHGAWSRALRRGVLVAAVITSLAALRLGDVFSVPAALFVIVLAALVEWHAVRRFDAPPTGG